MKKISAADNVNIAATFTQHFEQNVSQLVILGTLRMVEM